jgi:hypothetical protein
MSLKRCTARDLFSLTSRTITDEGYLYAPGSIARIGVQTYKARELGMDGGDKPVRLYRPPEEVFAPDSITSFDAKPITIGHPPEDVNADNWRQRAVGDVRDVKADGGLMKATLIVRDKAAIRAVLDGKQELSNGYSFDLDLTPGKTADGLEYDGIQRNVRGNHVAIVDCARGGPALRIADHQTGDGHMANRTIVIDGISLELEATQASLVEKIVGDAVKATKVAQDAVLAAEKRATDAETAQATAAAATAKLVTDHAAVVADLTNKILKPEQIEALAAERSKVVGDAARLVEGYKPEGKSVQAIRAEVLTSIIANDEALKPIATAMLGGLDPAKAPELILSAAFAGVAAARVADTGRTSAGDEAMARALAGDSQAADSQKLTGRALMMYRDNHAGKDPPKASA